MRPRHRNDCQLGRAFKLVTIALLLALPWSGTAAAPFVGAPEHTSGDYVETTVDIRVKVMGGDVAIERTWRDGAWHLNRHWAPLAILRDAADGSITSIERNGDAYEPSANDPDLFRLGKRRTIVATADGFRWSDRDGNWIDYDSDGRMLRYGDRNAQQASLAYDGQGRLSGVLDHDGDQVLWLDYDTDGRVIQVRDYTGRHVDYGYSGAGPRITRVTDLRGKVWTYGFSGGLLTSRTDPLGNSVSLEYNGQSRLVAISDDIGIWRRYVYDFDQTRREYLFRVIDGTARETDSWYARDGSLVRREINGQTVQTIAGDEDLRRITDYSGLTTELRYDGKGNLLSISYPDGTSKTWSWHARWALPLSMTNESGVVTRYAYDANGNLTRLTEAAGSAAERVTDYTYDAFGNRLTQRVLGDADTAEALTVWTYDEWGNRVSETDPEGNVTHYAHDVMGNVIERTDPRDKHWLTTYDVAGHRTGETNPLDQTATFAYDDAGNPTRYTDRNGNATDYAYDARNRRIRVTGPLGAVNTTEYDLADRAVQKTDPAGRVTRLEYDAAGRLSALLEPGDLHTEFAYADPDNGAAFNAAVTKGLPGRTEHYGYDRRGRRNRITVALPDGTTLLTLKTFDPVGNQLSETDPAGRTRSATYDGLSRILSLTDAAGGSQHFTWDDRGNLRSVENARGILIREYAYDRADGMLSESWPGGGLRSFDHDANGNLVERVSAQGQVTRHRYDDAGRLVATELFGDASAATPQRSIDYQYDAVGNRTAWTDSGAGATAGSPVSATIDYDAANRKLGEQIDFGPFQAGYSVEYAADGKQTALIYPDGLQVGFAYDDAGRLARVEIPGVGSIGVIAHTRSEPAEMRYPGGLSRHIDYDGLDRIVGLQVDDAAGATLMQQALEYDAAGNLVARRTEHGDYAFDYDVLDRLTAADNPTLPDEAYGYDATGNRVSSAAQPTWTYNDLDQLQSDGTYDYSYDADGNLVEKSAGGVVVQRYGYDLRDRLIEARDGAGALIGSYGYDPEDRRIRAIAGGDDIFYLYSDAGLLAELDAGGSLLRRYGWRPDGTWGTGLLWEQSATGVSFSLNDQIGVPWQLVDRSGTALWEARYASFGAASIVTGDPMDNPWRLPGQYLVPELGTHYNFHRFYDPAVGRYQRFDPLGIRASVNTYAYAFNNPLTRYDPLGLFCGSGSGANVSVCAGLIVGGGGEICSEAKCCDNDCGQYCCSYIKLCACVGIGGGLGASGSIAHDGCSVGVSFTGGVEGGCGPCSISASTTEISGKCCACQEAAKTCS